MSVEKTERPDRRDKKTFKLDKNAPRSGNALLVAKKRKNDSTSSLSEKSALRFSGDNSQNEFEDLNRSFSRLSQSSKESKSEDFGSAPQTTQIKIIRKSLMDFTDIVAGFDDRLTKTQEDIEFLGNSLQQIYKLLNRP